MDKQREINLFKEVYDDAMYAPLLRWNPKILESQVTIHHPAGIMDRWDNDKSMYEEFNRRFHDVIKDKIFLSNFSGMPATVVETLPEEIVEGEVLFDGMMLYDGIEGIEDDIQQMNSVTKDGERVNLEDYYTDNGAFDDDGMDRFIAALERLMTIDEFTKFLKMWNK